MHTFVKICLVVILIMVLVPVVGGVYKKWQARNDEENRRVQASVNGVVMRVMDFSEQEIEKWTLRDLVVTRAGREGGGHWEEFGATLVGPDGETVQDKVTGRYEFTPPEEKLRVEGSDGSVTLMELVTRPDGKGYSYSKTKPL